MIPSCRLPLHLSFTAHSGDDAHSSKRSLRRLQAISTRQVEQLIGIQAHSWWPAPEDKVSAYPSRRRFVNPRKITHPRRCCDPLHLRTHWLYLHQNWPARWRDRLEGTQSHQNHTFHHLQRSPHTIAGFSCELCACLWGHLWIFGLVFRLGEEGSTRPG
jgi:hypothetical protein